MKMKTLYNIRIMLAVMLLGIVAACEDDDKIPGASYDAGVWFYGTGDVIVQGKFDMDEYNKIFSGFYSFYFYPGVEEHIFELPEIRLMGKPVDYDRKVNLVAGEGSTAVEGVHFVIEDNVLPANAVSFTPKVLLLKKNLGDEEKMVKFVLEPFEEFPAQVFGDTVSDDKTFLISLRYELKFSNLVSEPPYWSQCGIFGDWSRVKFDFMYEKLGKYWGVEPVSPADRNYMYDDLLRMRRELQLWQTEHPGEKMLDEKAKQASF